MMTPEKRGHSLATDNQTAGLNLQSNDPEEEGGVAKGTDWADDMVEDVGKQDEESMAEAADQLDEIVEEAKE